MNANVDFQISGKSFSVVIPNYNHGNYIAESLKAILNQSTKAKEIVVIDDGSTDDSVKIIEQIAQSEASIKLVRNHTNMGSIKSIDKGLRQTTEEYVTVLSADDKVLSGFFEKSISLLGRYPTAGMCSSLTRSIDSEGKDLGILPSPKIRRIPSYLSPEEVRIILNNTGMFATGNTTFYKRESLLEFWCLAEELQAFWDGFMAHAIALKYGACFIPEPLAAWRKMDTGWSQATRKDISQGVFMINKFSHIMRSEEPNLFPEKFLWRYRKIETSDLGRRITASLIEQHQKTLKETSLLSEQNHSFWFRIQITLLKICCKLTELTLRLHLRSTYGLDKQRVINKILSLLGKNSV